MESRALGAQTVRFVGHRVHTRGIDPAIVEIEQRADGDREVEGLVCPPRGANNLEIDVCDPRRIVIDLVDEPKQRLVLLVERRRFVIGEDRIDKSGVSQKLRRNCGVGFQSKRTVIAL